MIKQLTLRNAVVTVNYTTGKVHTDRFAGHDCSTASFGTDVVPVALDRVWSTTRRERFAAARVLLKVLAVRATSDIPGLVKLVRDCESSQRSDTSAADVKAAKSAIRKVARYWPTRVACLEESVTVVLLLARQGKAVVWCHGAKTDPIKFHAWTEVKCMPAAEPASTSKFHAILKIGDK